VHASRWSPGARLAFRFSFVYFSLYACATQIAGGLFRFPGVSFPGFGLMWPARNITSWLAVRLFGIASPLASTGNSADTNFFWVQTSWLFVTAVIVALIWSLLDRRAERVALLKWFRLFLRLALAAQMFDYGLAKVIPTQFPPPSLTTLVQPVGNLSLTGMLWTAIGASTGYQLFTGWAEVLAGALLLVPLTAMAGALICLADMIQVFVLNMTFDIGLKLISFHLIMMTLVWLAPELSRLGRFLFLNQPVEPSNQPPLFGSPRANRTLLGVQVALGIYLVVAYTAISAGYWYGEGGAGSPKSPFFGIWDVKQLTIDDDVRPPVLNDYDRRWRRVIFDAPDVVVFQRTDDSFARYSASFDTQTDVLSLRKPGSRTWRTDFVIGHRSPDRMVFDGRMDQFKVHAELQRVEFDTFRLLNSTFRWVRPPDPPSNLEPQNPEH
jgi:hypothetical protein